MAEHEAMKYYRHLADGLSDMIEEGRLASLRQEDYEWLVDGLVKISATDPSNPGYHTKPSAEDVADMGEPFDTQEEKRGER
tara:strand:- start:276 stop:518 length:243 start_codon:yes stop_codon:yes gene_type:complete